MSNILIADPNPTMRRTLADTVRGFGHNVFEAEGGAAAVKILSEKKIQVFFVDVEILDQDDATLIAQVRKASPATSILAVLGLGEDGKKWIDEGALATVTKPFNIQGLRRIINEAIQSSKDYVAKPPAGSESPLRSSEISRGGFIGRFSKITILSVSTALLAAGGGIAAYFFMKSAPRAQVFSVPNDHLSSIVSSPDFLWACDWFDQSILQYGKGANLNLVKKTSFPELHPSALAWDGKTLWSYSSWERRLVRHKMSEGLPSDLELQAPESLEIGALCYGAGSLWIYDLKSSRIGKLDASGTLEVKEWYSPINRKKIIAMFWEGDRFWCVDETGLLYEQTLGKNLSVEKIYSLPASVREMQGTLSFFLKDGKKCWTGVEGARTLVSFPWKSIEAYKD